MNIFIDTLNPRSHIITPEKIHAALLFPAEEFLAGGLLERTIEDLENRHVEKIIFCSLGKEDMNLKELENLNPVIIGEKPGNSEENIPAEDKLATLCYAY